jgi:hypothetical protein
MRFSDAAMVLDDEEVCPRCVPGVWLNSMNKILIYTYVEEEGEEGGEVESV